MKPVMAAVLFLVMASLACVAGPVGRDLKPAMTGSRAETDKVPVMAGPAATVMAGSLNLRSVPDQAGPVDSKVITVMAAGDLFAVSRCEKINGLIWAYGTFTDGHGRSWQGWALASWLSAGACHD